MMAASKKAANDAVTAAQAAYHAGNKAKGDAESKKAHEAINGLREPAAVPPPVPPPVEPPPTPPVTSRPKSGYWLDNPSMTDGFMFDEPEWSAGEKLLGPCGLPHFAEGLEPSLSIIKHAASRGGTPFLDLGAGIKVADVISGKHDGHFAHVQKVALEFDEEMVFRFGWEFNLEDPPSFTTRPTPEQFLEAWARMAGIIKAPKLHRHWCANYFVKAWGGAVDPTPYIPPADQFELAGADIYVENWTTKQGIVDIFPVLEKIDKPILFGEVGFSKAKTKNRAEQLETFIGAAEETFVGRLYGIDYFQVNSGGAGDWDLLESDGTAQVWHALSTGAVTIG